MVAVALFDALKPRTSDYLDYNSWQSFMLSGNAQVHPLYREAYAGLLTEVVVDANPDLHQFKDAIEKGLGRVSGRSSNMYWRLIKNAKVTREDKLESIN